MNLLRRVLFLSVACLFAALSTGCASIVSGTNQSLSVVTHAASGEALPGATCSLVNDKGSWFVTTPGSVTVHRSYGDLAVKCSKEGSDPGIANFKSSTKGMAAGNILFGGLVGAGVDIATGAAYDYPDLIHVNMVSLTAIGQASKPVTVVNVNAEQQPATSISPQAASASSSPTIHITSENLIGKTWIYPHPSDEAKFGNVEITFGRDTVDAKNKRNRSNGTYRVNNDRVCIVFKEWNTSPCYFVIYEEGQMKVLLANSGMKASLTVQ
jgi:hypothetical protein